MPLPTDIDATYPDDVSARPPADARKKHQQYHDSLHVLHNRLETFDPTVPTHPDLAAHGAMGLATQAELNAEATARANADAALVPTTDARLSDARTPLAHRATHGLGGADALTAADLGAGTADATTFLRGDRTWAALPTTVAATTITTATHTAAVADAGKVVRMIFVGPSTLTIPANATTPLAIGTVINPYAAGGALTIAAAAGVTIRNNAAALAQHGECSLRKDGTDEWVRVG